MARLSPLLLLTRCSVAWGSLSTFLTTIKDPSSIDYVALCASMGKTWQGYSSSWSGGVTSVDVTCSGEHVSLICKDSSCTSPQAGGSPEMPAGTLRGCDRNAHGYCYGYTGEAKEEWCWLADEHGEKAIDGKPSACSSWNGFAAAAWCYKPAEPLDGQSTDGQGSHDSGGEGSADGAGGQWQCPAQWHTGATPRDAEAKTWTMAHNVYRCMHDVPFAKWSNPVADDIKTYLEPLTSMIHSSSYDVAPPAGPAGENLFWGSGTWSPGDATSGWYSEYKLCNTFPGCNSGGFTMGTGHFTAMVWKGAQELGCTSNSHGLKGCRYKGGDSKTCATPNMGGCFNGQVPEAKKSFQTCGRLVKQCFGSAALPSGLKAAGSRLFSARDDVAPQPRFARATWLTMAAAAGLASAAAGLVAVRRVRKRSQSIPAEVEGGSLFDAIAADERNVE